MDWHWPFWCLWRLPVPAEADVGAVEEWGLDSAPAVPEWAWAALADREWARCVPVRAVLAWAWEGEAACVWGSVEQVPAEV